MTTHNLPISKKAYDRFCARIKAAHEAFLLDATPMLRLLDSYLAGRDVSLEDVSPVQQYAFMLLIDEIDTAMARSARARQRRKHMSEKDTIVPAESADDSVNRTENSVTSDTLDAVTDKRIIPAESNKINSSRQARRAARYAPVRCRYQLPTDQSVYRGVVS